MTLVAMLALSGVASAHHFNSTVAGAVTVVKNETQVFHILANSSSAVECTEVAVTNANAVSGNQLTILADVHYGKCTASALKLKTTVTTAKYLFSADLNANLENTIVINVEGLCSVTVKPQNDLLKINYLNNGNNVILDPHVTGIVSEGTGGECDTKSSTGTYLGSVEVQVSGGKISWEEP